MIVVSVTDTLVLQKFRGNVGVTVIIIGFATNCLYPFEQDITADESVLVLRNKNRCS